LKYFFLYLSVAFFSFSKFLFPQELNDIKNPIANSLQLIIIITEDWEANKGYLQYFERNKYDDNWNSKTQPFEIAIGKNGLAWGYGLHGNQLSNYKTKKEGDGKSPAGVFNLGFVFGYNKPEEVKTLKMPYFYSHSKCFCIDDVNSEFYNLVIDSTLITNADWKSREKMKLKNDLYKWGITIENNSTPRIKGNGSCIFFHIWDEKEKPTAGCTVMSESKLVEIIYWLDKTKNPIVVQLPQNEYDKLKTVWKLP